MCRQLPLHCTARPRMPRMTGSFSSEVEDLHRDDCEILDFHRRWVDLEVVEPLPANSPDRKAGNERRNQSADGRTVAPKNVDVLDAGALQDVRDLRSGDSL